MPEATAGQGQRQSAVLVDNFKKALKSTQEIQLTVVGRKSGRKSSRPVWFVLEDDTLYLLPVMGSDTVWYKNMLENPTIGLTAKTITVTAMARPITDPAKVRDIVEKFRQKYGRGEVSKYYSKLDVAVEVALA
jgi:deazaflavin-dependent oxidoreductase (nitroreductase family)